MNEELMSTERMEEKERLRRNIMKQASLNEDIFCKGSTFEAFRDSFYSANATRRFQLLKSGLTNKIRQSTTNIEVSGISIKNGFVKILQGWKLSESETAANESNDEESRTKANDKLQPIQVRREVEGVERRLSREDGSDSPKDSSLQSDTSVDSEDSFASVIFVPKQDAPPVADVPATPGLQLGSTSAPPSPRVKHPPDMTNSRFKLISISPLLKQFPATSKSLPPPSPPGLSPRTLNPVFIRPFFGPTTVTNQQPMPGEMTVGPKRTEALNNGFQSPNSDLQPNKRSTEAEMNERNGFSEGRRPSLQNIRSYKSMSETIDVEEPRTVEDTAPLLSNKDECLDVVAEEKDYDMSKEEETRRAKLNQIKELLKQKPGFATRTKSSFPLIRRASTTASGHFENTPKILPRLLSLELFNPETDDLDSDSSGVSSPESVGSVISVISDDRYTKKDNTKSECTESEVLDSSAENVSDPSEATADESSGYVADSKEEETKTTADSTSSHSSRLLEAAANVASSLEDAVETAIQKTHTRPYSAQRSIETSSVGEGKGISKQSSLSDSYQLPEVEDTWNAECRQHLIVFTEKLSENLLHDIDQYSRKPELDEDGRSQAKDADARRRFDDSVAPAYDVASGKSSKSKYNMSNTIAWLSSTSNGFHESIEKVEASGLPRSNEDKTQIHRSSSEDIMDFVMVSNSGEFMNEKENVPMDKRAPEKPTYLRTANSMESSDIGESINTISFSDVSHATSTGRLCSSMVSLLSNNAEYPKSYAEKRRLQIQRRSASEEAPPRYPDNSKRSTDCLVTTTTGSNNSLSASSSQESLPSDRGGGAITYHQYYHVFREGELDQLINKYVENLHIISSYYDHASWCIVAEKVQVWTI